jgi:hypothetical protein
MSKPQVEALSQAEQEQFAAVVERLRQFRRRAGVPDGVTLEEAVALHMISAEELERARWGALAPPAPERTGKASARGEQVP